MKFFLSMILFLVLLTAAFIVGYKTETVTSEEAGADVDFGGIQRQDDVGGVRMGTGNGAPVVKRCSISGARC
mgnify:CR=1 FL=1|tara:strand:+ start:133938 stop:134153 length:216 start_codon:yes stop_codon:yes gene_type:complete